MLVEALKAYDWHSLATGTANIGVFVKDLPKLVDGRAGGFGADIEKNADYIHVRPMNGSNPP